VISGRQNQTAQDRASVGPSPRSPGHVLIEYGGRKIDTPDDSYRLRYVYYEGEKAVVTVMRGPEKITNEVTLEAMQ